MNEVISNLRSSGTRHVALYTSDPKGATEGHLTISVRHLIDSASGNETTSCDAVCHSRARILEGVFVVSRSVCEFSALVLSIWFFWSNL